MVEVNLATASKSELKNLLLQTEQEKGRNSAEAQRIRSFIAQQQEGTKERLPVRRFGFNVERVKEAQQQTLGRRQQARSNISRGQEALQETKERGEQLEQQRQLLSDVYFARKIQESTNPAAGFALENERQREFFRIFQQQDKEKKIQTEIGIAVSKGFITRTDGGFQFTEKGIQASREGKIDQFRYIQRPEIITTTTTSGGQLVGVRTEPEEPTIFGSTKLGKAYTKVIDVSKKVFLDPVYLIGAGGYEPKLDYNKKFIKPAVKGYEVSERFVSKNITQKIIPKDYSRRAASVITYGIFAVTPLAPFKRLKDPVSKNTAKFIAGTIKGTIDEAVERPILNTIIAGTGFTATKVIGGLKRTGKGSSRAAKVLKVSALTGIGGLLAFQTGRAVISEPTTVEKGQTFGRISVQAGSFALGSLAAQRITLASFQRNSIIGVKTPSTLPQGKFITVVKSTAEPSLGKVRVQSIATSKFIPKDTTLPPVEYAAATKGFAKYDTENFFRAINVGKAVRIDKLIKKSLPDKLVTKFGEISAGVALKAKPNVYKSVEIAAADVSVSNERLFRVGRATSGKIGDSIFSVGSTKRILSKTGTPQVVAYSEGKGTFFGEISFPKQSKLVFNPKTLKDLDTRSLFKLNKKGRLELIRPKLTKPSQNLGNKIDVGEVSRIQIQQGLKVESVIEKDLLKKYGKGTNIKPSGKTSITPFTISSIDERLTPSFKGGIKSLSKSSTDIKSRVLPRSKQNTGQITAQLQNTAQSTTQRTNLKNTIPIIPTPLIPIVKTPTTLLPPPLPLPRGIRKKKEDKKVRRFDEDLVIVPDFTSRALNLKVEIPKAKLKSFAAKGKSGLELRRIPVIK